MADDRTKAACHLGFSLAPESGWTVESQFGEPAVDDECWTSHARVVSAGESIPIRLFSPQCQVGSGGNGDPVIYTALEQLAQGVDPEFFATPLGQEGSPRATTSSALTTVITTTPRWG